MTVTLQHKRFGGQLLCLFLLLASPTYAVRLPPLRTPEGFVARLLINEVPFPGEVAYMNERDTRDAMKSVLAVLDNRVRHIPPGYTQRSIAATRAETILDVITAGGERGQVDGFYRDAQGRLSVHSRVTRRINYLRSIADKGTPGRFTRLLSVAVQYADDYLKSPETADDTFVHLTYISPYHVTSRGYCWMTDAHHFHPGGDFIAIPDTYNGSQGGNRFFTLKTRK